MNRCLAIRITGAWGYMIQVIGKETESTPVGRRIVCKRYFVKLVIYQALGIHLTNFRSIFPEDNAHRYRARQTERPDFVLNKLQADAYVFQMRSTTYVTRKLLAVGQFSKIVLCRGRWYIGTPKEHGVYMSQFKTHSMFEKLLY